MGRAGGWAPGSLGRVGPGGLISPIFRSGMPGSVAYMVKTWLLSSTIFTVSRSRTDLECGSTCSPAKVQVLLAASQVPSLYMTPVDMLSIQVAMNFFLLLS